jgi:tetratricopeptide (TPR) repeat protein
MTESRRAPNVPDRPETTRLEERRVAELLAEALTYRRGGALTRALSTYDAVLEATAEPVLASRALTGKSHAYRERCDWDAALAAAERAAATAAEVGLDVEEGEAYNAQAAVHHSRGELDLAAAVYARVLEVTQDPRVRGMALQNLGVVAAVRGDLDAADARFLEAHDSLRAAGDESGQAHVLNSYTAIALDRADHALAEERARMAVAAAQRVGDLALLGIARQNLAEALGGLGRFEEAEAAVTAALGQFEIVGNRLLRVKGLETLGVLAGQRGDADTARRFYERALELAREIGATTEAAALAARLADSA